MVASRCSGYRAMPVGIGRACLGLAAVLLIGTACKGGEGRDMGTTPSDTGEKAVPPERAGGGDGFPKETLAGAEAASGRSKEKKILDSPVAGSWYPGDPALLRQELDGALAAADVAQARRTGARIVGLVSPHAGYRYSGAVAAHGYRMLQGQNVRRVIVMGPSHHVPFAGLALPDATHWRTPLGEMPIDTAAVAALAQSPLFQVRPDAFRREHSVDMQIPFLQVVAPGAVLVPIVVGSLTPEAEKAAGDAIHALMDDGTVVVASSDFTHYGENFGYVPFRTDVPANLKALADDALAALQGRDVAAFRAHEARTEDTICGRHPIAVLLEALPKTAQAAVLKFDTSGRMTGEWDHTVSYASVVFQVPPDLREFQGVTVIPPVDQRFLLTLARDTLRQHVAGRALPDPEREKRLPESVKKDFGVFVTLKEHGDLRGCIGSIAPVEPLWKGVVRNAVNAASEDPRFRPVRPEEEPLIEIEVSILTPPTRVRGPEDIVIGRDGVMLTKGRNRAVFLPQVAPEQGWDLPTTLTHLATKAGLPGDAWKTGATFEVFQAQVFNEAGLKP